MRKTVELQKATVEPLLKQVAARIAAVVKAERHPEANACWKRCRIGILRSKTRA